MARIIFAVAAAVLLAAASPAAVLAAPASPKPSPSPSPKPGPCGLVATGSADALTNTVWVDWGNVSVAALSNTTLSVTVQLALGYYFQPLTNNIKVQPVTSRPTACPAGGAGTYDFKTTASCSTSGGSGTVLVTLPASSYTCGAAATTIYLWVHIDGTNGGVSRLWGAGY